MLFRLRVRNNRRPARHACMDWHAIGHILIVSVFASHPIFFGKYIFFSHAPVFFFFLMSRNAQQCSFLQPWVQQKQRGTEHFDVIHRKKRRVHPCVFPSAPYYFSGGVMCRATCLPRNSSHLPGRFSCILYLVPATAANITRLSRRWCRQAVHRIFFINRLSSPGIQIGKILHRVLSLFSLNLKHPTQTQYRL